LIQTTWKVERDAEPRGLIRPFLIRTINFPAQKGVEIRLKGERCPRQDPRGFLKSVRTKTGKAKKRSYADSRGGRKLCSVKVWTLNVYELDDATYTREGGGVKKGEDCIGNGTTVRLAENVEAH